MTLDVPASTPAHRPPRFASTSSSARHRPHLARRPRPPAGSRPGLSLRPWDVAGRGNGSSPGRPDGVWGLGTYRQDQLHGHFSFLRWTRGAVGQPRRIGHARRTGVGCRAELLVSPGGSDTRDARVFVHGPQRPGRLLASGARRSQLTLQTPAAIMRPVCGYPWRWYSYSLELFLVRRSMSRPTT